MSSLTSERAWVSIALLLAGCALLLHTYTLGFADLGGAFSPVFFPRIILSAWIVLAVLSLVIDILNSSIAASTQWGRVGIIALALIAYILFLQPLGFFICSVFFCATILLATGQRRFADIALFSLIIPGVLVGLFNHVLIMPLPVSPFFWWI